MPLNSVNTNIGAMAALQSLGAINTELFEVQRRISTGLRVASAKDDPSTWAIAQMQRSEVGALNAVRASLQRGQSIADVAMTAGETITDLLSEMKTLMLAAAAPGVTSAARDALNSDYVALRRQIDHTAATAEFNGINLISAGGTDKVRALANTKASATIDIDHVDLSTTGALLSVLPADLTGTLGTAQIDAMNGAMEGVTNAVARLGTGSKSLDTHLTFVEKLQDKMEESIGRLVDADLAKESARLQALQVRQQLALRSLQIANQAPSYLLQLFR